MAEWTAFPYDTCGYRMAPAALQACWGRLHLGDCEPPPGDDLTLHAWALFHAGEFQRAVQAGLKAAAQGQPGGLTVANKAQCVYACYLEKSEKTRFALLMEVAERATTHTHTEPGNANAHYLLAYALGRYAQGISVATALAQGLGHKVRASLVTAVQLQPLHADAHMALGMFHAEVIDTVGSLIGRTQGASREAGLMAFRTALRLNPDSALARIAYANGLSMLEGEPKAQDIERLYQEAAACTPLDATERLDTERARAELADGIEG
jgi:tetratricopeptide (TPR) repeat protein